jgi:hypothetical protein
LRAAAPHASSQAEDESLYFQGIGHFTPRGNEVAAGAIRDGVVASLENGSR